MKGQVFFGLFCVGLLNAAVLQAGSKDLPWRRRGIFCSSTVPCPQRLCCRDAQGNLVGGEGDGPQSWFLEGNGTCSFRPSGPGEICTDGCGCVKGYECYRTVTGFCCPPTTCWKKEDAQRDREYWQNCQPPTCFFPPVANPGGAP